MFFENFHKTPEYTGVIQNMEKEFRKIQKSKIKDDWRTELETLRMTVFEM
jgi:hypothetical protein